MLGRSDQCSYPISSNAVAPFKGPSSPTGHSGGYGYSAGGTQLAAQPYQSTTRRTLWPCALPAQINVFVCGCAVLGNGCHLIMMACRKMRGSGLHGATPLAQQHLWRHYMQGCHRAVLTGFHILKYRCFRMTLRAWWFRWLTALEKTPPSQHTSQKDLLTQLPTAVFPGPSRGAYPPNWSRPPHLSPSPQQKHQKGRPWTDTFIRTTSLVVTTRSPSMKRKEAGFHLKLPNSQHRRKAS